jgi:hypothetical protein
VLHNFGFVNDNATEAKAADDMITNDVQSVQSLNVGVDSVGGSVRRLLRNRRSVYVSVALRFQRSQPWGGELEIAYLDGYRKMKNQITDRVCEKLRSLLYEAPKSRRCTVAKANNAIPWRPQMFYFYLKLLISNFSALRPVFTDIK